jgi:hypothetical protein
MIRNKKLMFMALLSLCSVNLFGLVSASMGMPDLNSHGILGRDLFYNYGNASEAYNADAYDFMDASDSGYVSTTPDEPVGMKAAAVNAVVGTAGSALQQTLGEMYLTATNYGLAKAMGGTTSFVGKVLSFIGKPLGLAAVGEYVKGAANNVGGLADKPGWMKSFSAAGNLFGSTLSSVLLGKVVQKAVPQKVQEWNNKLQAWVQSFGLPGEVASEVLGAMYATGTQYATGWALKSLANAAGLPNVVGSAVGTIDKAGLPNLAKFVSVAAKVTGGIATSATKPLWMDGASGLGSFSKAVLTSALLQKFIARGVQNIDPEIQAAIASVQ